MIRVLLAATALLVCTAAADAAARQRPHARAKAAPVQAPPQQQIYPNRPAWAPAGACYTDEGYGRFLPCGMGGRDI